ncbi:hypothetical protein BKA93DRAFT_369574 [Sparassis latifolia]
MVVHCECPGTRQCLFLCVCQYQISLAILQSPSGSLVLSSGNRHVLWHTLPHTSGSCVGYVLTEKSVGVFRCRRGSRSSIGNPYFSSSQDEAEVFHVNRHNCATRVLCL